MLLTYIKVPVRNTIPALPLNDTTETEVSEPIFERRCSLNQYQYSHDWQGWDNTNPQYAAPVLQIINLENISGWYSITFILFDQDDHPFDRYEGKDYEDVRDELPLEKAAMVSEVLPVFLKANEGKEIIHPLKKTNPDRTYWAYAFISPPNRTICTTEVSYQNATEKLSASTAKQQVVTTYVSIWEYLGNLFLK